MNLLGDLILLFLLCCVAAAMLSGVAWLIFGSLILLAKLFTFMASLGFWIIVILLIAWVTGAFR